MGLLEQYRSVEIEFMAESAEYRDAPDEQREKLLPYINAILDAALDIRQDMVELHEPIPAASPIL